MDNDLKIRSFWQWFASNRQSIETMFVAERTRELSNLIDPQINNFDNSYTWEIGPGMTKKYSFTISPNGSKALLAATKEIIDVAPDLIEWEFHSARPPKKWNLTFQMTNVQGQKVTINANRWRYYLLKLGDDAYFDIVIYSDVIPRLDSSAMRAAARIVIDGIIGEELFLQFIGRITMKTNGQDTEVANLSSIKVLRDHLIYLQHGRN